MPDTFWALLLAHLIGDYPFQPNWMVGIKRTWAGLALHSLTHLGVLLVLARPSILIIWPYLVVLGLIHFGIDLLKNQVWQWRPQWVVGPYLFDQVLHLLSILLVTYWIELAAPGASYVLSKPWLVLGSALVFVTFAWFITERVVFYAKKTYADEMIAQKWSRMAMRVIVLLAVVWAGRQILPGVDPLFAATIALPIPYLSGNFRRRALLTDVAVALAAALLVLVAA